MKNIYFSSPTVSAQQAHSFPLLYFFSFSFPAGPAPPSRPKPAARPAPPPSLSPPLPRGARMSGSSPSSCAGRTLPSPPRPRVARTVSAWPARQGNPSRLYLSTADPPTLTRFQLAPSSRKPYPPPPLGLDELCCLPSTPARSWRSDAG